MALVTSLQNKAVESVATKLRGNVGTPFFVVGQKENLGKASAEWTLETRVERCPPPPVP